MGKIWHSSFHTIALMAFYYVIRWVNSKKLGNNRPLLLLLPSSRGSVIWYQNYGARLGS